VEVRGMVYSTGPGPAMLYVNSSDECY